MIQNRRAMVQPRQRPDLRTNAADLVETLRMARDAIDREWASIPALPERDRLGLLQGSLGSLGFVTDRLLVVMNDQGLDGPLMEEAEQLYDHFRRLEAEIQRRYPPE